MNAEFAAALTARLYRSTNNRTASTGLCIFVRITFHVPLQRDIRPPLTLVMAGVIEFMFK